MDHKGENIISKQSIVSGSLPIESGSPIEFGRARGCSFFSVKMAISDSGSKFLDSGSPPIESGHAQGCVLFWKMAIWDSGSQFWDSGSDSQMDLDLDVSAL